MTIVLQDPLNAVVPVAAVAVPVAVVPMPREGRTSALWRTAPSVPASTQDAEVLRPPLKEVQGPKRAQRGGKKGLNPGTATVEGPRKARKQL